MIIVQIFLKIKGEHVAAFEGATLANQVATRQEPGNIRFDFFKQIETGNTYSLIEIYHDDEARKAHLQTEHFTAWYEGTKNMIEDSSSFMFEALGGLE